MPIEKSIASSPGRRGDYNQPVGQFYSAISRHYHRLFPARQPQLEFLAGLTGPPPARVVDVASGTGEYVAALHGLGYDAHGIEVDFDMVAAARGRHPEIARRLIHGDMLELTDEVRGPCALAFCIGNSLPHLSGPAEAREAILQMWDLTAPEGCVALQVVNFDRVLAGAEPAGAGDEGLVFDLPSLSTADGESGVVELDRRYRIPRRRESDSADGAPLFLQFESELRSGGETHQSSLELLMLTRERLADCLPPDATVRWYGDFAGVEWSADSPASICVLSR
jgi:SAM-dependent methyltransferase